MNVTRRLGGVALLLCACAFDSPDDTSSEDSAATWPIDDDSGLRVAALPPLPELEPWPDNPRTAEKRELGRALFYDVRLSGAGSVACSTCHSPLAEFQSNLPRDLPSRTIPELRPNLPRHTPSLFNIVFAPVLHWDGSESDLYESMSRPFAEPNMDLTTLPKGAQSDVWALDHDSAKAQLKAKVQEEIPRYAALYSEAFDVDASSADEEEIWLWTGMALAVFVADAQTGDSAFDRWNRGEDEALTSDALAGLELFLGKGGCIACHNGPLLSDFQFHNLSLVEQTDTGIIIDPGREHVTEDPTDHGAFLTPSLRRVVRTSPYFHHGQEASLSAAIRHHAESGTQHPNHDPILDGLTPLTDDEVDAIVQLLRTLDGPGVDITQWAPPPEFP